MTSSALRFNVQYDLKRQITSQRLLDAGKAK